MQIEMDQPHKLVGESFKVDHRRRLRPHEDDSPLESTMGQDSQKIKWEEDGAHGQK